MKIWSVFALSGGHIISRPVFQDLGHIALQLRITTVFAFLHQIQLSNPLPVVLISTSKNESVFVAFSTVNLISLCCELRIDKKEEQDGRSCRRQKLHKRHQYNAGTVWELPMNFEQICFLLSVSRRNWLVLVQVGSPLSLRQFVCTSDH